MNAKKLVWTLRESEIPLKELIKEIKKILVGRAKEAANDQVGKKKKKKQDPAESAPPIPADVIVTIKAICHALSHLPPESDKRKMTIEADEDTIRKVLLEICGEKNAFKGGPIGELGLENTDNPDQFKLLIIKNQQANLSL